MLRRVVRSCSSSPRDSWITVCMETLSGLVGISRMLRRFRAAMLACRRLFLMTVQASISELMMRL